MLLKHSPFELDRESMILRNNKLLKHYDQLNLIKNRKNLFLPKINSPSKSTVFLFYFNNIYIYILVKNLDI